MCKLYGGIRTWLELDPFSLILEVVHERAAGRYWEKCNDKVVKM